MVLVVVQKPASHRGKPGGVRHSSSRAAGNCSGTAALTSPRVMGAPFGFMAFLGIISLIGVIVSHVIVLFDFIEEQHEHGAPLIEALST
ncbi:MAG: hypothetical protein AAB502_01670 [Chloroflexota bacterium]